MLRPGYTNTPAPKGSPSTAASSGKPLNSWICSEPRTITIRWNETVPRNGQISRETYGQRESCDFFERQRVEESREMANEEHLARLKQGVEAWNQWLWTHRDIRPNLGGADLSGAHLAGVDLGGADLDGVNLNRADLIEADLSSANLGGANIGRTVFGRIDLSTARGLETVQHAGPSTIGIDTLYRSDGNIPEIFLRGAGVPDEMITYSKSLAGKPFQYYSCFISYSSQDEVLAQRLHADLQDKGKVENRGRISVGY
jgi:hypothetical protein